MLVCSSSRYLWFLWKGVRSSLDNSNCSFDQHPELHVLRWEQNTQYYILLLVLANNMACSARSCSPQSHWFDVFEVELVDSKATNQTHKKIFQFFLSWLGIEPRTFQSWVNCLAVSAFRPNEWIWLLQKSPFPKLKW